MDNEKLDTRVKLSTLWIVVMFCMAFADIVGFMTPGALEEIIDQSAAPFPITQEIMLVFSVLLAIPIVMIYLSRVLKHGANRWANIIASGITILFVAGLGSTDLSYIFFATIHMDHASSAPAIPISTIESSDIDKHSSDLVECQRSQVCYCRHIEDHEKGPFPAVRLLLDHCKCGHTLGGEYIEDQ